MKKDLNCSEESSKNKESTGNDHKEKGMYEKEPWASIVKQQITVIRDEGTVNMLDLNAVFRLALAKGFLQLADFIFMNTKNYERFILTGDLDLIVNVSVTIDPS